ncbi:MAG: hydrogenase maturation nickel metallochaperone HypA [Bacteroidetes bacterium]|nr:hydrogenase maturation nickel metallochaperone HypA [Bacteroidota bacterium]
MHELSIAQNIVEIIHQYVPAAERDRVRSVFTTVGEHSGIVADSLTFSYQAITAATDLQRSMLVIEPQPFIIRCSACGTESRTEMGSIQCPACRAVETTVLSGTELRVREIELEDEPQEQS